MYYKSFCLIASDGEKYFNQGDIVKLDTKPIIFGRVLYFVQASKKNDFDKVVVVRQPDEVNIATDGVILLQLQECFANHTTG